jgi:IMP cyclohydrolase
MRLRVQGNVIGKFYLGFNCVRIINTQVDVFNGKLYDGFSH